MHTLSVFFLLMLFSLVVQEFESRPTFVVLPDVPNLDHKTAKGCKYNYQFYRPGGFIKSVFKDDRCLEIRCSPSGKIIQRLNRLPERCPEISSSTEPLSTTTTEPITTTTPLTTTLKTTPYGCQGEDGKFYAPGEQMNEGFDEGSNWCYGSYCDQHGQIIQWDNFNCKTTPPTTVPLTTTPMTTNEPLTTMSTTLTPLTTTPMTTPYGCQGEDGKFYAPGEQMNEGFDEGSNWCYGSYCDHHGQIVQWDNFNCKTTPPTTELAKSSTPPTTEPLTTMSTTLTPLTTTPMTTTPMTTPYGCKGDDGKFYAPGEQMNEGFDEGTNWCYGSYCDQHGQIIQWDNFNCKTTPPTTVPLTTTPMTTPYYGCQGEDGKLYAPGEKISEDSDGCFGSYCDQHGQIIQWDNFNCKSTESPTIIPVTEEEG